MRKSERVKALGCPGGLRCRSCSSGVDHDYRRKIVKKARREDKAFALKEAKAELTERE